MHTASSRFVHVIVAVGFALACGGCATRATKPEKAEDIPSGAVAGTLTINGASTTLRYAYARQHESGALEAKRLHLNEYQQPRDGVVYVLVTNRAVSDELITKIIEDKYEGAKDLSGVLLTIYPTGTLHWQSQFVTNTQLVYAYGSTSTGGPTPKIEDGRAIGMLALRNDDAVYQRALLVYFDAPLPAASMSSTASIGNFAAPPCGSKRALKDFSRVLPGKWAIESWFGDKGKMRTGTLSVDERIASSQFHGTFRFIMRDDQPDVIEQATLTCAGAAISVHGAVIPETHWWPDTLTLELKNRRMVGEGKDLMGEKAQVTLKKVH